MSRPVGSRRGSFLIGAIMLLLAPVNLACSKTCESGDGRCDGKNLQTCSQGCSDCEHEWSTPIPCAGSCVTESELRAFCSLTAEPDPKCANREGYPEGYCDNDLQVRCRAGYPVSRDRCEPPPGVSGTAACVETLAGLACRAGGPGPPADAGTRD